MTNVTQTLTKGTIGAVPPFAALALHIDTWAAPIQFCLGCSVSLLMAIGLSFDIVKKVREYREFKRQERIKEQRRLYFKTKHALKKQRKIKGINNPHNDGGDDIVDPIDARDFGVQSNESGFKRPE